MSGEKSFTSEPSKIYNAGSDGKLVFVWHFCLRSSFQGMNSTHKLRVYSICTLRLMYLKYCNDIWFFLQRLFLLLHAPLLGVILHALMWYLQLQSLETITLIVAHYEVCLISLAWWIWHFLKFIKRDLISKFNKYFKMFPY